MWLKVVVQVVLSYEQLTMQLFGMRDLKQQHNSLCDKERRSVMLLPVAIEIGR